MPSNPLKDTISKLTSPKIRKIPDSVDFEPDFSDVEAMAKQRYRVVLHSNKDKVVYVKTEKEQRKLQERDARMVMRQRRKDGEVVDEDYEKDVDDYIQKARSSSETIKSISNFKQFDDTVTDILSEEQLALRQEEEDSTAIEKAIAESREYEESQSQEPSEDPETVDYDDSDNEDSSEQMPVIEGAEVFANSSEDDDNDDAELVVDDKVDSNEDTDVDASPEDHEVEYVENEDEEEDEEEMKEYEQKNNELRRDVEVARALNADYKKRIEEMESRIHELEEQNMVLRKEFNEEHGSVRVSNGLSYSPGLLKNSVTSRKETSTTSSKTRTARSTASTKRTPKPTDMPSSAAPGKEVEKSDS